MNQFGCHFIHSVWTLIRLLKVEQLFELTQLSLEPHVWKNDWTTFAGKLESLLKLHVFFLH